FPSGEGGKALQLGPEFVAGLYGRQIDRRLFDYLQRGPQRRPAKYLRPAVGARRVSQRRFPAIRDELRLRAAVRPRASPRWKLEQGHRRVAGRMADQRYPV